MARAGRRTLVKPAGSWADISLLKELVRIVNEAQKRDAEDERQLYDPMLRDWPHLNGGSPIDGNHF